MQDSCKQRLTERLVDLVEQLNRHMHCRPQDDWEGLDLTILQIKTLAVLQHQGPQRMGSIANCLGSTLSAATSIIDRLVDKQLVQRHPDPDDRRVVICQLTRQGQEAVERFWRIGRMRIVELTEHLTSEELETVLKGVELLCQAAQTSAAISGPTESPV